MSLRPPRREEDEGGDDPLKEASWLYSYADLVTQLLLFTILSVTAVGIDKKMVPLEDPDEAAEGESKDEEMDHTAALLNEFVKRQNLGDMVAVDQSAGKVAIRLKSVLLFSQGKFELSDRAQEVLAGIVKLIGAIERDIRIEGHTDDVPIRSARMASNWELSTERAIAVVLFLEKAGITRTRISAAGYGEFHPLITNDSEQHRALNRRVEIVILED